MSRLSLFEGKVHFRKVEIVVILILLAVPRDVLFSADSVPMAEQSQRRDEHQGEDWTFFRGPRFDGHSAEKNLVDDWPDSGPPVLWTRELGQGYSAFVGYEDRVFTQGQTLSGQFLYCLDAHTGKTIWQYKVDWPYQGMGVYPGPRSTPTYAAGYVYFTAPDGLTGCLKADSGDLVWSRNVLTDYAGTGGDGFGYSCSPVVIDGLVILPVGGKSASMVALDAATGREVWSEGDGPGSYASALPIERNGRKLVVGYLQNSLVIHDRLTGELLVNVPLSIGYDEHSCWPIYREPDLWTSSPFRSGSQLYRLPEDFGSNEQLPVIWTSKSMSNDVVSSVLVDNHLFGFDIFDVQSKTQRPSRGMFRCLNFESGNEAWSQGTGKPRRGGDRDDPEEIGQAGIVVADGKLILLNERGELILLRANAEKLDVLERVSLLSGELTWTPPALHRGKVYLRNHSRAVCIYLGNPDDLKSHPPSLTVADVPQTKYRDWAGVIIPVEPEYMFDVPSPAWMWNWYLAALGMLVASSLTAFVVRRIACRNSIACGRLVDRCLAFSLGALGTTILSSQTGEFYFTWPLCLYIAFEPVVLSVRSRQKNDKTRRQRLFEWGSLLFFGATSVAYFVLCRRLSLVFEWSYLTGFLGAVPFLLLAQRVPENWRLRAPACGILRILAFSAFSLCGVLPLLLGY